MLNKLLRKLLEDNSSDKLWQETMYPCTGTSRDIEVSKISFKMGAITVLNTISKELIKEQENAKEN